MDRRGRRNGGRAAPCASSRRGEGRAQRGEGLTEALALPAQGAAQRHRGRWAWITCKCELQTLQHPPQKVKTKRN